MFALRFDFRNPAFAGIHMADRYQAGIEMAEWADRLGAASIIISERHGSEDGYLPSSLPITAAMAARTTNVRFNLAANVRFANLFHLGAWRKNPFDPVVCNGGSNMPAPLDLVSEVAQKQCDLAWSGHLEYVHDLLLILDSSHNGAGMDISVGTKDPTCVASGQRCGGIVAPVAFPAGALDWEPLIRAFGKRSRWVTADWATTY